MKKNIDLLHEPILPALTRLALPIMATSLVQMAYNMTDMASVSYTHLTLPTNSLV